MKGNLSIIRCKKSVIPDDFRYKRISSQTCFIRVSVSHAAVFYIPGRVTLGQGFLCIKACVR